MEKAPPTFLKGDMNMKLWELMVLFIVGGAISLGAILGLIWIAVKIIKAAWS